MIHLEKASSNTYKLWIQSKTNTNNVRSSCGYYEKIVIHMMKMRLKDKMLNIPTDIISFTILSFNVRLKKDLTHVFSKHEYIPFHFNPLYVPHDRFHLSKHLKQTPFTGC